MKSTLFLGVLCFTLAISTAGLAVKTVSLTAQVASLGAAATATAAAHRKSLATALARARAKARLRRVVAAIPLLGIPAAVAFERRDFADWQRDNPQGTHEQYRCNAMLLSGQVIDEVLQDLPDRIRPAPDKVLRLLPACEGSDTDQQRP